jgi:hypothetical protein
MAITLDIKIGDTILMGKFKNKKTIVKHIDKDEYGDLRINHRPVLKYRTPKAKKEEYNINSMKSLLSKHLQ